MVEQYISRLQLPLSSERMEAYRPDQGSDLEMVVNYFWNLRLCEALYPALNAAEIALRNSIHQALTAFYGNAYWFDNRQVLEAIQYSLVLKARNELQRRGQQMNDGRIVAELNFGFWVGLLARPYEQKIWGTNGFKLLRIVFPRTPRKERKRRHLYGHYSAANRLRNRVFHYEPIWNRPALMEDHVGLLTAIGWISPALRDSIRRIDRFPDVYQHGRGQVEEVVTREVARLAR